MTDAPPRSPDLDGLPLLAAALGPREAAFRRALDVIVRHLPAGSIPNARYDEVRSRLMDGLSEAWKAGVPRAMLDIVATGRDNGRAYQDGTVENVARTLYYELDLGSSEGLAAVPRAKARLAAAMAAGHPPAIAAALAPGPALMAEIEVVAGAMAYLRDRRVKRPPPGSAPPPPDLPKATLEAQARVRARMREILSDLRDRFAERVAEHVEGQAALMEEACAKLAADRAARDAMAGAAPGTPAPAGLLDDRRHRHLRQAAAQHRQTGKHRADYDPNTYETRRHPDGDARTAEYAKGEVERVFHLWTERNVEKLAPIAEATGGIEMVVHSARVSYGGVETSMAVTFPNGAGFGFSNAIEYATSPLGLPFARFPARYHDARRPDGSRIRGPSEARVKQELAPPPAPEPDASPAPGR